MAEILEYSHDLKAPPAHTGRCPCCGGQMELFFTVPNVPVNSCILMTTPEEATSYPRGDIELGVCKGCGFIGNLAFDPVKAEYSSRYEETQGFSPTFREFHDRLAADLVERYELRGKDVLEIGCGKGEFLALLCRLGGNRGLGFDPGYDHSRGVLSGVPDARVIADFYSESYSKHQADLVCCKMTLEHIPAPAEFVRISRLAMRPGGDSIIYFQVPEAMRILRDCAFEDIYYEHCSYFTEGSLSRLFRSQGFEVCALRSEYAGQYLAIEARLAPENSNSPPADEGDLPQILAQVEDFARRCKQKIEAWQSILEQGAKSGPVVLWGSGSKAVSFLSAVDQAGLVGRVVDINPHRQGHFMPGSGQPIIGPGDLTQDPPGTVIIMNPVYRREITADLERLGLAPEIHAL
jgi:SAM-dependent methyltransferase